MVDEKDMHESVAPGEELDRYPTTKSEGLHHDHIAAEALGGHTGDLPKGYYRSPGFIGTVAVSHLNHPGAATAILTIYIGNMSCTDFWLPRMGTSI